MECEAPAAHRRGHAKRGAVPPRHGVRTLRIHRRVRKVRADRDSRPGQLSEIHPEKRLSISAVLDQCAHNRRRNCRGVPTRRVITDRRDRYAISASLRRRLNEPAAAQHQLFLRQRCTRGEQKRTGDSERPPRDSLHDIASTKPNGQRLVFHDHSRNATNPSASTPRPNRITWNCVVANTKIQPSSATSAGIGYSHMR